jgi:beta-galactosidase
VRSVDRDADTLVVVVRSAPAATDLAMVSTFRWTGVDGGVRLQWSVSPEGTWDVPLPRLGLRFELPAAISGVTWFGLGPGEAYADSTQAVRVGRWSRTVEELQTPYVYPQENGNRRAVRWAELRTMGGAGLRISSPGTFELSARRWTSADLEAARHTSDLVARDAVFLNVDVAQNGLGTASCGPGVLPRYELHARPASLELIFSALD